MKVLFVSHTGLVGGAEHALLDVLTHLPAGVDPVVACPDGPLDGAIADAGIHRERLPPISATLRLHPARTPLALVELARAGRALRAAAQRSRPDVLHLNSTRAALMAAARRPGAPTVVWVHDSLGQGKANALVARAIAGTATRVVANSAHTASRFRAHAPGASVTVVHNGVDLARFDPARVSREEARARLGVAADGVALGMVAQITPWKGHDVAVEALARVRGEHPRTRLLIAGETKFLGRSVRFDNRAFLAELEARIAQAGLADAVTFLGERSDVPTVLRALDVLLVPSWEEPFGRVVIEAMAMGTPVVATTQGGPAEILDDGRTGRLVPPRRPELWARAIEELLVESAVREALARAASREVSRYALAACVDRLHDEYRLAAGA